MEGKIEGMLEGLLKKSFPSNCHLHHHSDDRSKENILRVDGLHKPPSIRRMFSSILRFECCSIVILRTCVPSEAIVVLELLEVREHILVLPAVVARHLRPPVVVCIATAHVHHGVDGATAAQHVGDQKVAARAVAVVGLGHCLQGERDWT